MGAVRSILGWGTALVQLTGRKTWRGALSRFASAHDAFDDAVARINIQGLARSPIPELPVTPETAVRERRRPPQKLRPFGGGFVSCLWCGAAERGSPLLGGCVPRCGRLRKVNEHQADAGDQEVLQRRR